MTLQSVDLSLNVHVRSCKTEFTAGAVFVSNISASFVSRQGRKRQKSTHCQAEVAHHAGTHQDVEATVLDYILCEDLSCHPDPLECLPGRMLPIPRDVVEVVHQWRAKLFGRSLRFHRFFGAKRRDKKSFELQRQRNKQNRIFSDMSPFQSCLSLKKKHLKAFLTGTGSETNDQIERWSCICRTFM